MHFETPVTTTTGFLAMLSGEGVCMQTMFVWDERTGVRDGVKDKRVAKPRRAQSGRIKARGGRLCPSDHPKDSRLERPVRPRESFTQSTGPTKTQLVSSLSPPSPSSPPPPKPRHEMATRAAVSRFAPALLRGTRVAAPSSSLPARRAAFARGYATEPEHSVSLGHQVYPHLGRPTAH